MTRKNSKRNPQAKQRLDELGRARARLADAIVEIVTNKTTPTELYNPVVDFVVETARDLFHEMQKDPVFIERALERLEEPTPP